MEKPHCGWESNSAQGERSHEPGMSDRHYRQLHGLWGTEPTENSVCVSVVLRLRLVNTLQRISLLLMKYNYPNRTRLGGRRHLIFKLFSACPLSHSVSIIGFIGSIMEKVKKYLFILPSLFPLHGLRKYTICLFTLYLKHTLLEFLTQGHLPRRGALAA